MYFSICGEKNIDLVQVHQLKCFSADVYSLL